MINPYDTDASDAGQFWIEVNEAGQWLLFCDAEEDPIAQFESATQAHLALARRTGQRYTDD